MTPVTLYWFRRDLRVEDHPGLMETASSGAVVPVFVLDPETEALGAAHKWRLGEGLGAFDALLRGHGSRLIVRRGDALKALRALAAEVGAGAVHWTRGYDPDSIARDSRVKAGLADAGLVARSHPGHLLFEPWTVETGQGGYYKVFTPYWRNVRTRPVAECLPVPKLDGPEVWPGSLTLDDLALGTDMNRGAQVLTHHTSVGAAAASRQLLEFAEEAMDGYHDDRDRLDLHGTSRLSGHLALGEISVRACWWQACQMREDGSQGAETFLKQLVWRDFAYHLIYHTPHIATQSWRPDWRDFPWQGDSDLAQAWRQGRTGEDVIDAAMREMYVTGQMHNRARMLVASYLTKHLLTDWRVGHDWFAECLTDWDPASNAMGWQWAAGSGPDAAPYFRVFNPAAQAEKFDPLGVYRSRYLAEDRTSPEQPALDFYDAIPRSWGLSASDPRPPPLVELSAGRQRALDAYQIYKKSAGGPAEHEAVV